MTGNGEIGTTVNQYVQLAPHVQTPHLIRIIDKTEKLTRSPSLPLLLLIHHSPDKTPLQYLMFQERGWIIPLLHVGDGEGDEWESGVAYGHHQRRYEGR